MILVYPCAISNPIPSNQGTYGTVHAGHVRLQQSQGVNVHKKRRLMMIPVAIKTFKPISTTTQQQLAAAEEEAAGELQPWMARELAAMRHLPRHAHVLGVRSVLRHSYHANGGQDGEESTISLVFPFMDYDLGVRFPFYSSVHHMRLRFIDCYSC